MRYLYVMLSRTHTGMGKLIRFCTKGEYNHVSLCVDDSLTKFISFARYRQDVPLAGGAITEPPERLLSCEGGLPVIIYRLEITPEEAKQIEMLFTEVEKGNLIYNTLGALLSSCHIRCPVPGAYTCLEFAGAVLGTSTLSINALQTTLEPWKFYQGNLFDLLQVNDDQSDPYFQKRGFWKGSWDTMVHFKVLLLRTLRLERLQDPVAVYELKILDHNTAKKSMLKNS